MDSIVIRGARENNLKGINLTIPKGKITAFVGVSGSGKSSIAFNTIAVESMRQLYETFPLYVRNRMPHYPKPEVDFIDNLSAALVIDQKPFTGDIRSTVGTMTEAGPMLRLLYSRFSSEEAMTSDMFSFNDPSGMCPACGGVGKTVRFDMNKVLDRSLSLNAGAIRLPGFQPDSYFWQIYANSGLFDNDKPLCQYTEEEWERFLHGSGFVVEIRNHTGKVWDDSYKTNYEGLKDKIDRLYLKKTGRMSKLTENILEHFSEEVPCAACSGRRLNRQALSYEIMGKNIWEMGEMEVSELIPFLRTYDNSDARSLIDSILVVLSRVEDVGLGYLNLNRISNFLSGGEAQRLKIVRNLGSSLTGMTYIFDEPSIGLHAMDIGRLNDLILRLKERGNTVLLVEHDPEVIRIADEIVEMGPGGGNAGGNVVFHGDYPSLLRAETPTGIWFRSQSEEQGSVREPAGWIKMEHCKKNNLKDISVDIPLGALTVVAGLSGAGKSTLACGELVSRVPDVVHISQAPAGKTSRSNPATYVGVMDEIRRIYGKESGKGAGMFSFNSKGACPRCGGKGIIVTEMAYMDPVAVPCDICGGKRYREEVLEYRYKGKNIAEVMNMTVEEAMQFFNSKKICEKLSTLQRVGLGYLTLGQSTATLSGGECQRMKLAAHLKSRRRIYVMDEPTTGLHGRDVMQLLELLDRLVDNGNTVIVVEHEPNVIRHADWVIDLGPFGGNRGGELVFQGTVQDFLTCPHSATASFLRGEVLHN